MKSSATFSSALPSFTSSPPPHSSLSPPSPTSASSPSFNVCMIGTGEYTTGYVPTLHQAAPDKKKGVVALVLFDLRSRGYVDRLSLCGVRGSKMLSIRQHLATSISDCYKNLDSSLTGGCFPSDFEDYDVKAYKKAIDQLSPGDGVTIFTPDSTHFEIALYAIQRKLHVLLAKPMVKSVLEHFILRDQARLHRTLVQVDVHKRWDMVYADARERIQNFGEFSYFSSYMSQPKTQLETFKTWLNKQNRSSDISYYLNSHHVDFHCWAMQGVAIPKTITAFSSTGGAAKILASSSSANSSLNDICGEKEEETSHQKTKTEIEDVITLVCEWENIRKNSGKRGDSNSNIYSASSDTTSSDTTSSSSRSQSNNRIEHRGIGVYTACWVAPEGAEVHSQQRFTCLSEGGETRVDQAHRGYDVTTTGKYTSMNPMYMKYTPDVNGEFAGQRGYGYLSIESWVKTCRKLNQMELTLEEANRQLPTIENTIEVTAILEGGRRSLDEGGNKIDIQQIIETAKEEAEKLLFSDVEE